MHMRRMITLATAAALMAGCGVGVGEHGTRLVVDEADMSGRVLYMLPDVSQVPYTARELEEQGIEVSEAIPVRVEIFEGTAVAWFAPDGEARIGSEWIIALWGVERVPTSGETSGEPSVGGTYTTTTTTDAEFDTRGTYDIELSIAPSAGEATVIEFLDRLGTPEELAYLEELITYHPGCLQE